MQTPYHEMSLRVRTAADIMEATAQVIQSSQVQSHPVDSVPMEMSQDTTAPTTAVIAAAPVTEAPIPMSQDVLYAIL